MQRVKAHNLRKLGDEKKLVDELTKHRVSFEPDSCRWEDSLDLVSSFSRSNHCARFILFSKSSTSSECLRSLPSLRSSSPRSSRLERTSPSAWLSSVSRESQLPERRTRRRDTLQRIWDSRRPEHGAENWPSLSRRSLPSAPRRRPKTTNSESIHLPLEALPCWRQFTPCDICKSGEVRSSPRAIDKSSSVSSHRRHANQSHLSQEWTSQFV